jgi:molecular chaperone Hsp33
LSQDYSKRFLIQEADIRGCIVRLNKSFTDCYDHQQYPEPLLHLLGEFLTAATLLGNSLKFTGRLVLQVNATEPVSLVMSEFATDSKIRGIIRGSYPDQDSLDMTSLFKDGTLAITIEPSQGERYQSLVPVSASTLSECLSYYFQQSEQLATQIILHCDGRSATGFMLQQLPAQQLHSEESRDQQWQHCCLMASTISSQELLDLPDELLLSRLYGDWDVSLYEPVPINFHCDCSQQRMANALLALGEQELKDLLDQQQTLSIQCEFCGESYQMDSDTIIRAAQGRNKPH